MNGVVAPDKRVSRSQASGPHLEILGQQLPSLRLRGLNQTPYRKTLQLTEPNVVECLIDKTLYDRIGLSADEPNDLQHVDPLTEVLVIAGIAGQTTFDSFLSAS